jgi:hypothetical protein
LCVCSTALAQSICNDSGCLLDAFSTFQRSEPANLGIVASWVISERFAGRGEPEPSPPHYHAHFQASIRTGLDSEGVLVSPRSTSSCDRLSPLANVCFGLTVLPPAFINTCTDLAQAAFLEHRLVPSFMWPVVVTSGISPVFLNVRHRLWPARLLT